MPTILLSLEHVKEALLSEFYLYSEFVFFLRLQQTVIFTRVVKVSKAKLSQESVYTPNAVPSVRATSFESVFSSISLDVKEANAIERLLVENYQVGQSNEEQVAKDVEILKKTTSEIKTIGKQATILTGERIHKVRQMLRPYKNGTFTKWLEATFGTRKTGYNMLAYYELYTALPRDDLKDKLKKLPQRSAYILASRGGDIETKAEIINEYRNESHNELVVLIQEKLPISQDDKRQGKSSNERVLSSIKEAVQKLEKRKGSLSEFEKIELSSIARAIHLVLGV
ncbi:MAG: hypothetical protein FJZ57_04995 [Chlamydiae bacterium]|nr:hypothetical protein [Chlamydiota bacterium]